MFLTVLYLLPKPLGWRDFEVSGDNLSSLECKPQQVVLLSSAERLETGETSLFSLFTANKRHWPALLQLPVICFISTKNKTRFVLRPVGCQSHHQEAGRKKPAFNCRWKRRVMFSKARHSDSKVKTKPKESWYYSLKPNWPLEVITWGQKSDDSSIS